MKEAMKAGASTSASSKKGAMSREEKERLREEKEMKRRQDAILEKERNLELKNKAAAAAALSSDNGGLKNGGDTGISSSFSSIDSSLPSNPGFISVDNTKREEELEIRKPQPSSVNNSSNNSSNDSSNNNDEGKLKLAPVRLPTKFSFAAGGNRSNVKFSFGKK
jgi:hypothetical protein